MCLIISGQSSKIRDTLLNTSGLIKDIYETNPDGIGIMYGTSKGLKVVKVLPKTVAEATDFIRKLPKDDRELALHWRWATHGDKNMDNCHPYDIIPGYVALMHNGVLHTGNDADKSKSDTWHFVQDFMQTAVHAYPDLVFDAGYALMLEELIGDNRLVIMNGEGRIQHINKEQGIEDAGLWFSNTYAWRPALLIKGYRYASSTLSKYMGTSYDPYSSWEAYKEDDELPLPVSKYAGAHSAGYDESLHEWKHDDALWDGAHPSATMLLSLLNDADVDTMSDVMSTYPLTTINTIFANFKPMPTSFTSEKDLCVSEAIAYRAIMGEKLPELHEYARDPKRADTLAEVMCYYANWVSKEAYVQPALLKLVA